MINENQDNNQQLNGKQYFLRIFLRIYFIILFICSVIGLSFSRQIGAVLIFSLVSSLLIFICCNCGQCYKTRVISGHVLVGAPDMALPHDQQIAVIIVSPSSSSARQPSDDSLPHSSAVAPMYPVYGPTHFQPPPSYDESQRQYK